MKMKRYFAADSRQALRELREDQGPDAVILSNRRVNGGVEIIAALDYDEAMTNFSLGNPEELSTIAPVMSSASNSSATRPSPARSFSNELEHAQYSGQSSSEAILAEQEVTHASNEESSALNKIQDELKGLRNIMEAPLMQFAWGETGRVQPLYASLLKQLMTLGLSSKLSQSIAKRTANQGLNKHSWLESLKLLAKLVPIDNDDILSNGGIVSLIGPTGVGKTTTIAKLAARFALKHGRRGITLITTDNYRIGAHEQLRTYGRILGVPVHVASDNDELRVLLKEAKDKSGEHNLTLIDTAGICQKDNRLSDQLTMLNIRDMDIKNYLVLSATGQMNLQDNVICAFSQLKLQGCMLTKIDEAASLGEIISVLIQHELPLHFVCDGQKVPDDLHQARGQLLVKEAVKLMRNTNKSPSTEELAYTFGGMVNNAII
ncbi:MAG: flagellar biosynthesis protein FlhF [Gammaproteobacteria bacterium]|nr:flagellar biosynthesis protein FlhF [Gammaproteobacteria bacterium]